jgi:signal transduction histidine kinase
MYERGIRHFYQASIRNKLLLTIPTITLLVWGAALAFNLLFLHQEIHLRFLPVFLEQGIDVRQVQAFLAQQEIAMVMIGAIAVGTQLILLVVVAHRITQPIRSLTQQVADLERHPGSRRPVMIETEDEVGNLGRKLADLLRRLDQYETKLQRRSAEAAVGRLAAQIAHDLRSPMSTLKISLRQLRTQAIASTPALEAALNLLRLSGARLEAIVSDLLDRRMNRARQLRRFSLHRALDELLGEMVAQPIAAGLTIEKKYFPRALPIIGDRSQILRALENIFKNALEAMATLDRPEGHYLTVATEMQEGAVCIRIVDTGPGMSVDRREEILQGEHCSGKAEGHGIGMQVVRDVVQSHGGRLDCFTGEGSGTTFIVLLPIRPKMAQQQAVLEEGTDAMQIQIPYGATGPIVVIDDDPGMQEQWRIIIEAQGLTPEVYPCWEAYNRCKQPILPAAAIIDYHFSNSAVDGPAIIERLRLRGIRHLVLCTADYWKPSVKDLAARQKLILCPKPLADISFVQSTRAQALVPVVDPLHNVRRLLVIDDDAGIHVAWGIERERCQVDHVAAFASMEDCEAARPDYCSFDCALVDRNIPTSEWRVDHTIAFLKRKGIMQVYVATGEAPEDLERDPLLAGADGYCLEKIPSSPKGALS